MHVTEVSSTILQMSSDKKKINILKGTIHRFGVISMPVNFYTTIFLSLNTQIPQQGGKVSTF